MTREGRETPLLPYTSMSFALPTPGLDLPCAVANFTGIPVVVCQEFQSFGKLFWANVQARIAEPEHLAIRPCREKEDNFKLVVN